MGSWESVVDSVGVEAPVGDSEIMGSIVDSVGESVWNLSLIL